MAFLSNSGEYSILVAAVTSFGSIIPAAAAILFPEMKNPSFRLLVGLGLERFVFRVLDICCSPVGGTYQFTVSS